MRSGNAFEPKVMPSAEAARKKERRVIGLPMYLLIAGFVSVCIFFAVILAK